MIWEICAAKILRTANCLKFTKMNKKIPAEENIFGNLQARQKNKKSSNTSLLLLCCSNNQKGQVLGLRRNDRENPNDEINAFQTTTYCD